MKQSIEIIGISDIRELEECLDLVAPEFLKAICEDISQGKFYDQEGFGKFIENQRTRLFYRGFVKIGDHPSPLERVEVFLKMGKRNDADDILAVFTGGKQKLYGRELYYVLDTEDKILVAIGSRM